MKIILRKKEFIAFKERRTLINIERVGLLQCIFIVTALSPFLGEHGTHDCDRRRDAGREPECTN